MKIIKQLKAVSDETRLRILYILLFYELNVNEIVSVIGMIQSGVSRHLKILLESGLLASRKDGSYIYYAAAQNPSCATLIEMIRDTVATERQAQIDVKQAEYVIKERRKRTRHFFSQVALKWDVLKRQVIGELDINQIIKDKAGHFQVVADLGCGTGELLEIMETSRARRLIGVDSSVEMLDQARSRLKHVDRVDLRLGELEHLPMKNDEAQCVIMNMVLHHISMPYKVIQEAGRVVQEDGLFILSDFQKHDNENIRNIIGGAWLGFDNEKIGTWLKSAGFMLQSMETFDVNHGLHVNIFYAKKRHTEMR